MFVWAPLAKKRTYYRASLVRPLSLTLEDCRQSRYEPETFLLSRGDAEKVQEAEKALVAEVAKQNEKWFQNALTHKQVEKRFATALGLENGITLDKALDGKGPLRTLLLTGVRIFKNHWAPIWVGEAEGVAPGGVDDIGIDRGDIEDATQKLHSEVEGTCEDIADTIRLLTEFAKELEEAFEECRAATQMDVDAWQAHSDAVYKKISLYRSGIVLSRKNISGACK